MSELPRLVEQDNDFERELIRSAHHDRPGERALERTLLRLGVGLALPASFASAAPMAGAGARLSVAALVKSLVTGLALGVVTAGGAHVTGRVLAQRTQGEATKLGRSAIPAAPVSTATGSSALHAAEHSLPPANEAARAPAAALALVEPGESARLPRSRGAALAPPVPAASPSTAPERPRSSVGSMADDTRETAASVLAAETRALEAARRALADGKASLALTTLTSYERAFPQGVLRPEGLVLKVRALLAAGDRRTAEALGRRLIAQAPTSGHADAVRAALGLQSNP